MTSRLGTIVIITAESGHGVANDLRERLSDRYPAEQTVFVSGGSPPSSEVTALIWLVGPVESVDSEWLVSFVAGATCDRVPVLPVVLPGHQYTAFDNTPVWDSLGHLSALELVSGNLNGQLDSITNALDAVIRSSLASTNQRIGAGLWDTLLIFPLVVMLSEAFISVDLSSLTLAADVNRRASMLIVLVAVRIAYSMSMIWKRGATIGMELCGIKVERGRSGSRSCWHRPLLVRASYQIGLLLTLSAIMQFKFQWMFHAYAFYSAPALSAIFLAAWMGGDLGRAIIGFDRSDAVIGVSTVRMRRGTL